MRKYHQYQVRAYIYHARDMHGTSPSGFSGSKEKGLGSGCLLWFESVGPAFAFTQAPPSAHMMHICTHIYPRPPKYIHPHKYARTCYHAHIFSSLMSTIIIFADPYCVVSLGSKSTRTLVIRNSVTPMWDEAILLDVRIYGRPENIQASPPILSMQFKSKNVMVCVPSCFFHISTPPLLHFTLSTPPLPTSPSPPLHSHLTHSTPPLPTLPSPLLRSSTPYL